MKLGKWTIVVPDKRIIKQYDEGLNNGIGYLIESTDFWESNLGKNIIAIQYTGIANDTDQVEYNDGKNNSSFTGNIKIFSDEWDKEHLKNLQLKWDNDNLFKDPSETQEEKINRLGPRPQNYNSSNVF